MSLVIRKATRRQTKARICICGPTGAGKTKWALRIASGLGKRILGIDTENRSMSLYVGDHGLDFDVIELDPDTEGGYDPRNYIDAIEMGERERYDVIVVDSLTHAWTGSGGALEMVDKANNKFAAWKDVTPIQNALTNAITHCKCHIVATLRSKMEYVLEEQDAGNGRKKQVPVKVGLGPIQRAGFEYEFSVIGECDPVTHSLKVTKSRVSAVDGKAFAVGQVEVLARTLYEFHELGEASAPPAAPPPPPPTQQPKSEPTRKLPTITSKNYEPAPSVPFQSLTLPQLTEYLANYEAKAKDPNLNSSHRYQVENHVQAAQLELKRRRELETEMTQEPPADPTFPVGPGWAAPDGDAADNRDTAA